MSILMFRELQTAVYSLVIPKVDAYQRMARKQPEVLLDRVVLGFFRGASLRCLFGRRLVNQGCNPAPPLGRAQFPHQHACQSVRIGR